MTENILIKTKDLSKNFYLRTSFFAKEKKYVKALDKVNIEIFKQETVGVVGESGCGKTTLGRILLNLIKPTAGDVYFEGQNIYKMNHADWRKTRKEMQIVFQNPYLSFDPRFSILRSLSEPLITHTNLKRDEIETAARETLQRVGMPGDAIYRYPHEFSGGQLQRIAIARALILNPKFIVLDEPTSALDVSVQAQILNLLRQLQKELNLTYMFISHDLGVVQFISNRIAVMYLGKIVELITTKDLLAGNIQHPYTKILLSSIPEVYPSERHERIIVPKNIADATRPPSGCTFHPRCPYSMDICANVEPLLQKIGENHWSACHLIDEANIQEIKNKFTKGELIMPSGKISNMEDAKAIVLGCLILGTGGGGQAERGLKMFEEALKEGLEITWVDADTIPDDALTIQPYGMGSVAPVSQETWDEIKEAGLVDIFSLDNMVQAVKELGEFLGKPIGAIVPAEPGAANLPEPLVTGARMGIPVVDGDYAGRCIPEEMQTTPFLAGKNSYPFSSVDQWGDVAIVKKTQNAHMLERIGKMLAVAAYVGTAMAATPLSGKEMKEILVPNTVTLSFDIGRAIQNAREAGEDPIAAVLEVTKGWRVFEGDVTKKDWEDRDGYMFGTTYIEGTGEYAGHTLKVWFKNENHISWLDDKPWICSPDLLTLAYPDGTGTSNTTVDAGDHVIAIAIKGVEAFRTEFGLNKAAGPRYFGFDIDYIPVEEIVTKG